MKRLEKYQNKRDFTKTNEPVGRAKKGEKKLRFVVQHHYASKEHYDFRLEHLGVLLSWAIPKGPSFNSKDKRLAIMVEDHPLDYINFEGVIPQGQYGGGTVMVWDSGKYQPKKNITRSLKEGLLQFELFGKRLKGIWKLIRIDNIEKENSWLLIKSDDKYAQNEPMIEQFITSVKSGKTIQQIEQT